MKQLALVLAACALLFLGISGCNRTKNEAAAPSPHSQAQSAVETGPALSGKVVETMDSGGYTYVSLEKNGQKTWVAMPQTKVAVGQEVTCQPGMVMRNFTSKTLKRTFDSIVFSGGLL